MVRVHGGSLHKTASLAKPFSKPKRQQIPLKIIQVNEDKRTSVDCWLEAIVPRSTFRLERRKLLGFEGGNQRIKSG